MTTSTASVGVRNRFRAVVERLLPWFDPAEERDRARNTEALRRRSIAVRIRAEREIARAYLQADKAMRDGD